MPLDPDGVSAGTLLSLEIPDSLFAEHEWVEEGRRDYREALIPAELVNRYGPPAVEADA